MPASSASTTIGHRIREARARRGVTQEVLAGCARIDVTSLARVERGEVLTTVDTLIRIASALEEPVGALLDGIGADDLPDKPQVYSVRDFLAEREQRR